MSLQIKMIANILHSGYVQDIYVNVVVFFHYYINTEQNYFPK